MQGTLSSVFTRRIPPFGLQFLSIFHDSLNDRAHRKVYEAFKEACLETTNPVGGGSGRKKYKQVSANACLFEQMNRKKPRVSRKSEKKSMAGMRVGTKPVPPRTSICSQNAQSQAESSSSRNIASPAVLSSPSFGLPRGNYVAAGPGSAVVVPTAAVARENRGLHQEIPAPHSLIRHYHCSSFATAHSDLQLLSEEARTILLGISTSSMFYPTATAAAALSNPTNHLDAYITRMALARLQRDGFL